MVYIVVDKFFKPRAIVTLFERHIVTPFYNNGVDFRITLLTSGWPPNNIFVFLTL